MKRYKIPDNIKEIVINETGELVYLKKELFEIKLNEWAMGTSWELLEEIK